MLTKIVSKNFDIPNSHKLEVALANGRYSSIDKLFTMKPEEVTAEVTKSGLRGKGGGGAACGPKWELMPPVDERPRYLIVNGDESEPGTFKDRQIFQYDPHILIEGIICTCWAIQANHAYIYIRGEYKFFIDRLNEAIKEAYEAKIIGDKIMDKYDFKVDITVHRGGGAYICGEKSALIESLEGKRGHPRLKPHGKECEWFFDNPATVNNVETISSVPNIVENGAEGYTKYGTEKSPGTMLFAISGPVKNPGVYEMAYGNKMIDFLNVLGGGMLEGKKLKAIIPGGSSCPILTASEVEKAVLDYESMWDIGSTLGTGGMIVIDEDTSMVEVAKNIIEFYHHESCGQCTPCREGTGWIDKILKKVIAGEASDKDLKTIMDVCDTLNGKTVCVFAPAVKDIIASIVKKFPEEFKAYLKN
ncbi:NADH-quinone oxidoreductase subunit NuoF [Aliarcobacter butzleri]|uniref:NADH-quinone oxidoreductase subunit NuoF n=1 Tax=Aliarcobacter butzleri TaxID=28197 RepID=A0AAP4UYN7_9BACT|nr:NADH-quinone oxidoreductase subunit NuoF [Aliarcobacter butzleri]AGR76638.1 NADH:ubiquinone oxidoreductase I, chain F [Aliarcobacter butzleri 7h1h]MBF7069944.1 NADH-quinone oxidoreductase subunit NuoF [Aliarcobacter butzleri]MCG3659755.1 NADH-quinone oxidoreductase subunit NuoF [Aliarcobacter butzleri]MCG3662100.1 NADH-quinone oxidoreductase subunit NuoF [Aliarcobacter butzleri]MCG3664809.1 NADH-quinone oxidoreductase subunit NuoF [Aliarcobacter butzleri]